MSDYIIHGRVTLKTHHTPTRRMIHRSGTISADNELIRGPELPVPHALVIAQFPGDTGHYLLYLDEDGNEITDTYHDGLQEALEQAKWEFNVEADEWDEGSWKLE